MARVFSPPPVVPCRLPLECGAHFDYACKLQNGTTLTGRCDLVGDRLCCDTRTSLCFFCSFFAGETAGADRPLDDFNGRPRLAVARMGEGPPRSCRRAHLRGGEAIVKTGSKSGWTYVFLKNYGCNERCSKSRDLLRCTRPSAACLALVSLTAWCCFCAVCFLRCLVDRLIVVEYECQLL